MKKLCFTLILSVSIFAFQVSAAENKSRPALTVTVIQAKQQQLTNQLVATGDIAAWQEIVVSSEVNGLPLAKLLVEVGDHVKKGQLLAEFDAAFLLLDIQQSKASLLEAEAQLQEVSLDADRVRQLQGSGALSEREISQRLSSEQMAKARVAAAKASLDSLALRLKRSQVIASETGVISARQATLGAISATGTELFRLIRQGRLEWRAKVPAAELSKLKIGDRAVLSFSDGSKVSGKIRQIAPTLDVKERLALVYVDLDNSNKLRAGMFAQGRFDFGSNQTMTLPHQSVVIRDGFNYIFTVDENDQVKQLKVKTGRRVGNQVELLTAIPASQKVVVQGAGFLNDGDVVRVVE